MTRTLEIPSELDAQIERLAREHGIDADLLFKESVTRLFQQITEMAEELITKMEEDRIDVSSPGRVELMTLHPASDYVVMSGIQAHSAQVSSAQMPVETARRALSSPETATASQLDRRARLAALRGSVTGNGPTVDEFLAERAAEGRAEAGL